MIVYTTHNIKKNNYKNKKKGTIYRAIFRKREHKCWNNRGEDTRVNVYRIVNEDTLGNPVYMDKNGIVYNSIYNFRKDIPTNKKKWQTS